MRSLRPPRTGTPADLLVVGLGNPGPDYIHTRHNVGQVTLQLLAQRHGIVLKKALGKAFWGHARVDGKLLALGLPGTFMNLSGEGVAPLVRRYGVDDLSRLVLIHDELDLEVGRVHIKAGGGLAGHNGLKSVKHHLKDDAFVRVRIGIGRPQGRQSVSDYVLSPAAGEQKADLAAAIQRSADAVDMILAQGLTPAMNAFNGQTYG